MEKNYEKDWYVLLGSILVAIVCFVIVFIACDAIALPFQVALNADAELIKESSNITCITSHWQFIAFGAVGIFFIFIFIA